MKTKKRDSLTLSLENINKKAIDARDRQFKTYLTQMFCQFINYVYLLTDQFKHSVESFPLGSYIILFRDHFLLNSEILPSNFSAGKYKRRFWCSLLQHVIEGVERNTHHQSGSPLSCLKEEAVKRHQIPFCFSWSF